MFFPETFVWCTGTNRLYTYHNVLNVGVEWFILIRIGEVPGSNLGSDTGYPD
jgi:hypothetical protein